MGSAVEVEDGRDQCGAQGGQQASRGILPLAAGPDPVRHGHLLYAWTHLLLSKVRRDLAAAAVRLALGRGWAAASGRQREPRLVYAQVRWFGPEHAGHLPDVLLVLLSQRVPHRTPTG